LNEYSVWLATVENSKTARIIVNLTTAQQPGEGSGWCAQGVVAAAPLERTGSDENHSPRVTTGIIQNNGVRG